MNVPIIRLEIERMRDTLCIALSEHTALISEEVQKAVEQFVTPENINSIVTAEVNRTLKSVIEDEIKAFYSFGPGRETVRNAVIRRLEKSEDLLDLP